LRVAVSIERRNATQHRNVQQRNRNATVTQHAQHEELNVNKQASGQ
jgi:hypothetical protein